MRKRPGSSPSFPSRNRRPGSPRPRASETLNELQSCTLVLLVLRRARRFTADRFEQRGDVGVITRVARSVQVHEARRWSDDHDSAELRQISEPAGDPMALRLGLRVSLSRASVEKRSRQAALEARRSVGIPADVGEHGHARPRKILGTKESARLLDGAIADDHDVAAAFDDFRDGGDDVVHHLMAKNATELADEHVHGGPRPPVLAQTKRAPVEGAHARRRNASREEITIDLRFVQFRAHMQEYGRQPKADRNPASRPDRSSGATTRL